MQYLDENPRGPNCPEGDYSTVFLTDCDRGLGAGEMPYCLARPEQMLKSLILLLKRFLVPGGYVLDGHYWYHPWDFREIYHFEVKKNKIVSFLVDPFEMERARKAFREELGLSPDEEVDDDDVYSHYLDECEGFYARTCRKFGERQIKAYNEWLKGLRNQKKKRSSAKPPGSYT
ncbi:MAG: hypothetical protein Q4G65_15155 [bacterium]|nr:hypothetical protein [bacterium]